MITRLIGTGAKLLSYVAALCLFLMMAQIVLDVVMKYVFNAPIEGNLEVVSFYYMVSALMTTLSPLVAASRATAPRAIEFDATIRLE